jgi:hypothetical protein
MGRSCVSRPYTLIEQRAVVPIRGGSSNTNRHRFALLTEVPMTVVDRLLQAIRFSAACCLLTAAFAFAGTEQAEALGEGGCKYNPLNACVTPGGGGENRKCGDGAEQCLTCDYDPGSSCYCGGGPHVEHYYTDDTCIT